MRRFPVRHLLICTVLVTGVILSFLVFSDNPGASNPSANGNGATVSMSGSLNGLGEPAVVGEASLLPVALVDELNGSNGSYEPTSSDSARVKVLIRNGDSLSSIFRRIGVSHQDLLEIQDASPEQWKRQDLRAGLHISYALNDDGKLDYFEYSPEELTSYTFRRIGNKLTSEVATRKVVSNKTYRYVKIERGDSVISAGLAAGIRQEKTVWKLPKLLQWDIDFYHDIHPGDSYQILYYENFVDGEYVGDGEILALQFDRGERTYAIVRYDFEGIFKGYFTRDGYAIKKRFLRAPLEYKRISSNFSMRRLHPIDKVVRPHLGTDYAAPTGTPVYATGDGTVETAGHTRANGNYVVLAHDRVYKTKYLHLHKIDPAVKKGATVKQGQRIGSVGMTGKATGPHLHYEFLVHGEHQNPATIHLPDGDPLSESEIEQFQAHADELLNRMNALQQQVEDSEPAIVQR